MIDVKGNRTIVAYDTLGRRTVIDNPDAGRTEYRYDPSDNLIAKVTANLRASGQETRYPYEFNRLREIR